MTNINTIHPVINNPHLSTFEGDGCNTTLMRELNTIIRGKYD